MPAEPDLTILYRESRHRITELVSGLDADEAAAPAPACPGWTVHDVIAHLCGVVEDAQAGRLTGPPPPEMTAAEVARHREDATVDLLATWADLAAPFETAIGNEGTWPAVIDVVTHEHDIRGALGRPGDRDTTGVKRSAHTLVRYLRTSAPLTVTVDGTDVVTGPEGAGTLRLDTTSFEALRFRMGRRSRAQLRAMGWSGDPSAILDELVVFGPAPNDILE